MTVRRPKTDGARKRSILVVCEGEKTEPDYLAHWQRKYRKTVTVEVVKAAGVPTTLVSDALERSRIAKREARKGGGDVYDSIWVMFDHDDHHDVRAQVDRAEQAGLRVAFSNPCIELWFLLHFKDQTAYIDRARAQSLCRPYLGAGKALSEAGFATMLTNYETARDRAQRLEGIHQGNGNWLHDNPGSTVWRLIEEIRSGP